MIGINNAIVVLGDRLSVKCYIPNAHSQSTNIIAMTTLKKDTILVTAGFALHFFIFIFCFFAKSWYQKSQNKHFFFLT